MITILRYWAVSLITVLGISSIIFGIAGLLNDEERLGVEKGLSPCLGLLRFAFVGGGRAAIFDTSGLPDAIINPPGWWG